MGANGTCLLCGSSHWGTPIEADGRDGLASLRLCRTCGTLVPTFAVAEPDCPRAARTAWQASYHERLWAADDHFGLDTAAARAMRLAWEIHAALDPAARDGLVCDIGAGRGNILHALQRTRLNVIGCEPSARLVALARRAYLLGPGVLLEADADGLFRHLETTGQRPSAFVLWHVLEHLEAPLEVLERCLSLGTPDARLFVELPLPIVEDIFPEHRCFPTPLSMAWLCQRLGLSILSANVSLDPPRFRFFARRSGPNAAPEPGDVAALIPEYRRLCPFADRLFSEPQEQ